MEIVRWIVASSKIGGESWINSKNNYFVGIVLFVCMCSVRGMDGLRCESIGG